MVRYALLIIISLSFLGTPAARAEDIRIVTNTMAPLKYEVDGEFRGICIDLLVEILESMGESDVRNKITGTSWNRAYDETLHIPGTILSSMARTPSRIESFKWVGPIYSLHLALIGKAERHYFIESIDDIEKFRVGTQKATAPESLLFKQGHAPTSTQRIHKHENALLMLKDDRIDLLAHAVEPSFHAMLALGMNHEDYSVYYTIKRVDLYFSLNRSFSDEFVAEMQKALDAMKQPGPDGVSRYDQIINQHVRTRTNRRTP